MKLRQEKCPGLQNNHYCQMLQRDQASRETNTRFCSSTSTMLIVRRIIHKDTQIEKPSLKKLEMAAKEVVPL